MRRPNCKALYAFCQNAYDIQKHTLEKYLLHSEVKQLMEKTKVLHPPQEILITEEILEMRSMDPLCFIFIGIEFFRKGGREVIQILAELKKDYDFKLILISPLTYDSFTDFSLEEIEKSVQKF